MSGAASDPQAYDAVVVGAGPAGLTAATYLGRFRRRVLVLDGGPARAAWIPESHNTPGFPNGIGGPELLRRLRAQAEEFGAVIQSAPADRLEIAFSGFRLEAGGRTLEAATVLLATGVVDRLPGIADIETSIRKSRVRMCPICDAYEAIGARIAVLGDDESALKEADFLRTYSPDVTVLMTGEAGPETPDTLRIALSDLQFEPREVTLRREGAAERRFDFLYLALGCTTQNALATALGARLDADGNLLTDSHQMTSVEGLYAAGDVVRSLNQISVAVGEAAIAATAMHNRLRGG